MASQPQPEWVVPNPGIPRAFGWMNVIFGSLLLLVGVGSAVWMVYAPTYMKQVQVQVEQSQAKVKAQREAQIADLKKKEDAAKTEQEKKEFQTERQAAESAPQPPDFSDLGATDMVSDPRYMAYSWGEVGLAILLNIAMIVAGAGLLAMADWGRRLAIGVAWLKILRLAAMTVITLTVIVPMTSERMQRAFDKVEAQAKTQPGAGPGPGFANQMARMTAVFGAISSVAFAVLGSVYPGLSIWYLTRPRARAACTRRPSADRPGKPGGSPEDFPGEWVTDEPGGR